jgi:hypothetical protein
MAEHSFSINIRIRTEERVLRVQSNKDDAGANYFTISSGSETLGVLNQRSDGMWSWKDSRSSQLDADAIGKSIQDFLEN